MGYPLEFCQRCRNAILTDGGCINCAAEDNGFRYPMPSEIADWQHRGRGRASVRGCPVRITETSLTVYHGESISKHGNR